MGSISGEEMGEMARFVLACWFLVPYGIGAGVVGVLAVLAGPMTWPIAAVSFPVSAAILALFWSIWQNSWNE